jgi:hypothetical protein
VGGSYNFKWEEFSINTRRSLRLLDRDNFWRNAFQDVAPVELSVEEKSWLNLVHFQSGNEEDQYLQPYDVGTLGESKEKIFSRLGEETQSNSFLRIQKVIAAVILACTQDYRECFTFRVMSYILHQNWDNPLEGKPGYFEPFTEGSKGRIYLSAQARDVMIAKKISILLELTPYWQGPTGSFGDEWKAAREVALFLVGNPYINWSIIKKARSIGQFVMFAATTKGQHLMWPAVEKEESEVKHKERLVPIGVRDVDESSTAIGYLSATQEQFARDLAEVESHGLVHLPNLYREMVSADFTSKSLATDMLFSAPDQSVGYIYGRADTAAIDQVESADAVGVLSEHEMYPSDSLNRFPFRRKCSNRACVYCKLVEIWRNAITEELMSSGAMSFTGFKIAAPLMLTNHGSGIAPVSKRVIIDGREVTLKFKSKREAFLVIGASLFDPREMRAAKRRTLKAGFRNDRGRRIRMIFQMPVNVFVFEIPFASLAYAYQARSGSFSIAKQDSRPFSNFGPQIRATSYHDILSVATDVESMDAASKMYNVRLAMIQGEFEALSTLPAEGWGPYPPIFSDGRKVSGLANMFLDLYTGFDQLRFSVSNMGKTTVIQGDMVFSGELHTSAIHSFTNLAIQEVIEALLPEAWRDKFHSEPPRRVFRSYTGDDGITLWRKMTSGTWSRDEITFLNKFYSDTARAFGLIINMDKTILSPNSMEYLKKKATLGHFIPFGMRATLFVKEHDQKQSERFGVIKSLQSSLAELSVRGAPKEFCRRFLIAMAMLGFDVQSTGPEEHTPWTDSFQMDVGFRRLTSMPIALLYIPASLGGMGFLEKTIFIDSKDAHVFLNILSNPHLRAFLVAASTKFAGHTWEAELDVPLEDLVPEARTNLGLVRSALDRERLTNSTEALKRLALHYPGYRFPIRLAYSRAPERMLESAKQTLVVSSKLRNASRLKLKTILDQVWRDYLRLLEDPPSSEQCYQAAMRQLGKRSFEWLRYVKIDVGSPVEPVWGEALASPVATTDPDLEALYKLVGVGIAPLSQYRAFGSFMTLLDPKFPRDIISETVFKMIAASPYGSDQKWVTDILIAMGAESNHATAFAAKVTRQKLNMVELNAMQGWSLSDSLTSLLDLRSENMARFADVSAMPTFLQPMILGFAFVYSLLHTQCTRQVKISPIDDSAAKSLFRHYAKKR